jgi:hypothetical protein
MNPNNNPAGVYDEEEEVEEEAASVQPTQPSAPVQANQPQQTAGILQNQPSNANPPGIYDEGEEEGVEPPEAPPGEKPLEFWEDLKTGFNKSALYDLSSAITGVKAIAPKQKPGFWSSVIQESGALIADASVMALGAVIGAEAGTIAGLGHPAVIAAGGSAGAFAFPEFIKESMREYRQYQEKGGDLTFGEFLDSADRVASKTLNAGAFGVILGSIKHVKPMLEKIPGIKQLFDTKYVGSFSEEASILGAEIGTATTLPAAMEGRLPTKEDVAHAAVLFTGMRAGQLPVQLAANIANSRSSRFNYALADQVQDLNLSYPPLQEFRQFKEAIYKNSKELDQNLAAFDESYIGNIVSRINNISPTEFLSADQAGRQMRHIIKFPEPEQPTPSTATPEPVKPIKESIPLGRNPLVDAIQTISRTEAPSKQELGHRIAEAYHESRREAIEPLQQRYEVMDGLTEGFEIIDDDAPELIQGFIDKFGEVALPGSQHSQIISIARRMRDLFVERNDEGEVIGARNFPINDLINLNRDIKKIPNWQVPAEMKQNLGILTGQIDEIITGQLNNIEPLIAEEYVNVNRDYRNFKLRFDNDEMQPLYSRTEKGETVADKFTKLDQFTQLEQALDDNPRGHHVINLLRREAWTKKIGRDALRARTETEFEKSTRHLDFEERDGRDLMNFLDPEQRNVAVQSMEHANRVRQSAIETAERNVNNKEQYAREMKEWKKNESGRTKADKEAIANVQTKQDLLVSLLKEDPAKIVGNMESIEGIRRVKEASKNVQGGKELYDSLVRYETERMFDFMRKGYINTGRAPYKELKIQMRDKEFRSKLKELNGEEFVREIDQLVDVADSLSNNFKEQKVKYREDPTTFNSILNIYTMLGIMTGDITSPLMVFTARKTALKLANKGWNIWTSKKTYDPGEIHKVLSAARAAKKGNKLEIRRQASRLQPPYLN